MSKDPDVNIVTPRGETALSIAVKKNKLEIVKLLIEKGADVKHRNKDGLSAIDFAILPGFKDIAVYLFSRLNNDKK